MALSNFAIVANLTTSTSNFTVGDQSASDLPSGHIALTGPIGDGETFPVQFTGPAGSGNTELSVGTGTNSFSVFVFTENGYCNIYPAQQPHNVHLD